MADKRLTTASLDPIFRNSKAYTDWKVAEGSLTPWQREYLQGKEAEERAAKFSASMSLSGVAQEFDGEAVSYAVNVAVRFAGQGVEAAVTGTSANIRDGEFAAVGAGQYRRQAVIAPPATGNGSIGTSFSAKVTYTDEYGSLEKTVTASHTRYAPVRVLSKGGADAPSGDEIRSAAQKMVRASIAGDHTLTVTPGEYVWICVPAFMTIKTVTSAGFAVPMEAAVEAAVVIGATTVSYRCYRTSSAPQSSPMNIKIT